MTLLLVMVVAGSLAGAGLLLIIRGTVAPAPPLAELVAELHRPRQESQLTRRERLDAAAERFALLGLGDRTSDLEVCERSVARFTQDRLVWAMLGASGGLAGVALRPVASFSWFTTPVAVFAILGGAVGGWFYALVDLRSDAAKARREFVTSLASYLELVSILMAGGAGVQTALYEAAVIGRGRGYRHLRAALSAANSRRHEPWGEFGELGRRLGVQELQDLEAAMTLAGEGARVRESLSAKATALRERDLNQQEAQAQAKTETMVLPVAMMFAGFLLLIGYPALAGLSGP